MESCGVWPRRFWNLRSSSRARSVACEGIDISYGQADGGCLGDSPWRREECGGGGGRLRGGDSGHDMDWLGQQRYGSTHGSRRAGRQAGGRRAVEQLGRGREAEEQKASRRAGQGPCSQCSQCSPSASPATGLFPRAPSPGNRLTTRPRHMHWASTTPHAAACTRSSLPGPSPPLPNVLPVLDARAAIPLGRQIAA
jgi:hypothetical protein